MSAYLAADVYKALKDNNCTFEGDAFVIGAGWITADCQVFMLPEPTEKDGKHWLDADVVDQIFIDRWLGCRLKLKRY